MRFTVGQQVFVQTGRRDVRSTTVTRVGRRLVTTNLGVFDGETGAPSKDGYGYLYSVEEWEHKLREFYAFDALLHVGVTVNGASKVSAAAVYDAVKGLYGLPDQPPAVP